MKIQSTLTWLCLAIFPSLAFSFGVDLHAHIFMEEGVNVIYHGGFFRPNIRAKKWNHSKRSQVNEELLKKSELSIVVVALYAAPILSGESVYRSILKQIKMAEKFVARNPEWIIARSSTEAKNAIAQGKKVLVLSVEGAHGIHTPNKLQVLFEKGVRIITVLHLTKDKIGSPALQETKKAIFSTPINQMFCRDRDPNGVKINCKGLTTYGKKLADRLIDMGIWIDLSHASDKAAETIISKHHQRNIPLLYTHGTIRSKLAFERGTSLTVFENFKKLGGIFGLVPSPILLGRTESCEGTADAFKEHYDIVATYLTPEQITIGTDTNGMVNHIKPRSLNSRCNLESRFTLFDQNGGWWNYSHTYPLYREIASLTPQIGKPDRIIERFLAEWNRIEKAARP